MLINYFVRLILVASALAAGGCTTYRYSCSLKEPPKRALGVGPYRIEKIVFISTQVSLIAGDLRDLCHETSSKSLKRVILQLEERNTKVYRRFWLLNCLSFGIVPGQQTVSVDFDVYVNVDGKWREECDFTLSYEKRMRFTPLGLWPFVGRKYDGECYETIISFGHAWSARAQKDVIDYQLFNGLIGGE